LSHTYPLIFLAIKTGLLIRMLSRDCFMGDLSASGMFVLQGSRSGPDSTFPDIPGL
jgi:hypothetical protein